MRVLERKLLRDLGRLKTQAVAIALVVASGVASFVATVTTYRSLRVSQEQYYAGGRFADVWVRLARAPRSVLREVAAVPGVTAVEGRLAAQAVLDVPGLEEPATGLLVSVPTRAGHSLNDLHVRRGRHVEPGRPGEALVSEAFAQSHALAPGATVGATVAGHRVALRVVGIALSPEHVMQVPPGGIVPDDRRFGVFWVLQEELEALLDLRGAVNEIAVRVSRPGDVAGVIAALDRLLDRYGGEGAYGRASQPSHLMLEDHIVQLEGLAVVVPGIFLLVAGFLVSMVSSRLVGTQRAQIGMLRAFGYSRWRIAQHYLELVLAIVLVGVAAGIPVGVKLGQVMAVFYATFFRFPVLVFRLEPGVVALGTLAAILGSVVGAMGSLRTIARLPPIVAMAPAAPPYRPTLLDRLSLPRWIPPAVRMIGRNVTRRPVRALVTAGGMSLAVAILVLGEASADSLDRIIEVQFRAAQREDLAVDLIHPRSLERWRDFAALPGVRRAEPFRTVPARLRVAGQVQDVTLQGLPPSSALRRIVDQEDLRGTPPPPDGVLVSAWLAQRFGLRRGDLLPLEIREGRRRVVIARMVGTVREPLGGFAYLDLAALGRLLDEPATYSGVNLLVDPVRRSELYAELKRAPQVMAVHFRRASEENFRAMSDQSVRFIRRLVIVFSVVIAFGVVYNSARIAVAERGYELATLRVLGFTRDEVSLGLLGEIALVAVPAIPLGLAVGHALSAAVAAAMSSERFRMPVVVEPRTYVFAVGVFAAAALASALLVRRRLDRIELTEVLKARE